MMSPNTAQKSDPKRHQKDIKEYGKNIMLLMV